MTSSYWSSSSALILSCPPASSSSYIFACLDVCDSLFFMLSLFVTLYIFLHLTAMYSSTFGKGWVGRSCLHFLLWVSFGSFSLRELTCMHCMYLAPWTRKVLCGSFLCAIYKFSFIYFSFIQPRGMARHRTYMNWRVLCLILNIAEAPYFGSLHTREIDVKMF